MNCTEELTPSVLSSLWKPLGLCAPYLNKDVLNNKLGDCATNVVKFVTELKDSDMKDKVSLVCQLFINDFSFYFTNFLLGIFIKGSIEDF